MGRREGNEPKQVTAPRECGQWRGTSELRGLAQWTRHCPKAGRAVNGEGPRSCVWGSGLCLPRSGLLEPQTKSDTEPPDLRMISKRSWPGTAEKPQTKSDTEPPS